MMSSTAATSKNYAEGKRFREPFSFAAVQKVPGTTSGGGILAYPTPEVSAMPEKTNDWDPKAKAASPSPQRDEEREMADDEEDLEEDDDFEDSDEEEDEDEVEEE
jgi:hypothetical protein